MLAALCPLTNLCLRGSHALGLKVVRAVGKLGKYNLSCFFGNGNYLVHVRVPVHFQHFRLSTIAVSNFWGM